MSSFGDAANATASPSSDLASVRSVAAAAASAEREGGQPQGQQTQARQGPPAPAPSAAQPAVSLSPNLSALIAGARIEASVVGPEEGGLVVRTSSARFLLSGSKPLPADTKLALEIVRIDSTIHARLTFIDGKAPARPLPVTLTLTGIATKVPAAPTPAHAGPSPSPAEPASVLGRELNATVLRPTVGRPQTVPRALSAAPAPNPTPPSAPLPAPTPGPRSGPPVAPPPFFAGQTLVVRILDVPQAPSQAASARVEAPAADSAGPKAPTSTGAPLQSAPAHTPVGSVTSQAAPSSPRPAAPATPASVSPLPGPSGVGSAPSVPIEHALVVGAGSDGRPLIEVGQTLIRIEAPVALAEGSRIEIELRPATGSAPHAAPATGSTLPNAAQTADWPVLREAVLALAAAEPAAVARLAENKLPTPGPRLTGALLFFLSALRLGDLERWLGRDVLRQFEQVAARGLVTRLRDEFRQLGQGTERAAAGEWRTVAVPLLNGAQIGHLRISSREHHDTGERKPGSRLSRFLIDLDLSRLGPLQVDGLIQARRLDLVIRSERPLAEVVRTGIESVFHQSMESHDLTGGLAFRREALVKIAEVEIDAASWSKNGVLA